MGEIEPTIVGTDHDWDALNSRVHSLRASWEQFVLLGSPRVDVRAEILSSWQRSKNMGVDPFHLNQVFLPPGDLKRRLRDNEELIEIASPILANLSENVKGSGFRVDLFDKDLYLMAQFGDKATLHVSEGFGSKLGASRNEATTGTNAINLACIMERAVQLVGPEHYCAELHYWTCSAAPIFLPGCEMAGVINIAGHYQLMHRHTLGMAIAIAKAIEYSLLQKQLRNELEIYSNSIIDIIESMSEGIVVLNEEGKISLLNGNAAKMLGMDPHLAVGSYIEKTLGADTPFSRTLRHGATIHDEEFLPSTRGSRRDVLYCSTKTIQGKESSKFNVIGVIRGKKQARVFLKNMAGFKAHFSFEDIIGQSPVHLHAIKFARQAAILPTNILLQGSSGTGKELFAQAIHNISDRRNGPFVGINCAAMPAELIESELFGYDGGAFTGARKEGRPGKIELAEDGTLFLDEISAMPLNMQAKLLRVLQNKTFIRLGGNREIQFNARIIAAANRDLWQEVRQGNFREDLFFRINVVTINIPSIDERREDIPTLIEHFCRKHARRFNREFIFAPDAIAALEPYRWPGNVRELEHLVERCAVLAFSRGDNRIRREDVLSYEPIRSYQKQSNMPKTDPGDELANRVFNVEKEAIVAAIASAGGNVVKAAKQLGISRITLYRKISRYGIPLDKPGRRQP